MSLEDHQEKFPVLSRAQISRNGALFDPEKVRRGGIWSPGELVKTGKCCFCHGETGREVVAREDGLIINECSECKLAFLDPRPGPKQLTEYYSDGYFSGSKDFFHGTDYCLERDKAIHDGGVTGYREIVANFDLKGKTVLDVGCASGALLCLLREHQIKEVVGIDSAQGPISFGVEHYGLDLRCQTLETANLPDASFDLITLIDVIEHVEDLNSFLVGLRRVIKNGGHIFVITPNYAAYHFARDKWTCLYKDFEHLQYFNPDSLEKVGARSGFSLEKVWTDSLPTKTLEYPRLHRHGLHRVLHPEVAARNGIAALRYRRAVAKRPLIGANLNAILQAI